MTAARSDSVLSLIRTAGFHRQRIVQPFLLPDYFNLLPDSRTDQSVPHNAHGKIDDARDDDGGRDSHIRHLTVLKGRIRGKIHPVIKGVHDNGDHNAAGSQKYRSVKQACTYGYDALYDPYGVSSLGIAQVRQAENNGGEKRDREDFVLSLEVVHADRDRKATEHDLLAEARGERHDDTQCRRVEKQAVIHYIQQPRQEQLDQKRNKEQANFPKRDLRPEDTLERWGKPPLLCQQTEDPRDAHKQILDKIGGADVPGQTTDKSCRDNREQHGEQGMLFAQSMFSFHNVPFYISARNGVDLRRGLCRGYMHAAENISIYPPLRNISIVYEL